MSFKAKPKKPKRFSKVKIQILKPIEENIEEKI